MPKYKTVEQVRAELDAINPELIKKYKIKIMPDKTIKNNKIVPNKNGGVEILIDGKISIVSHELSYGGKKGLYEILPYIGGKHIKEVFDTFTDVAGGLSLREAIEISETILKLEELVKKYF